MAEFVKCPRCQRYEETIITLRCRVEDAIQQVDAAVARAEGGLGIAEEMAEEFANLLEAEDYPQADVLRRWQDWLKGGDAQ